MNTDRVLTLAINRLTVLRSDEKLMLAEVVHSVEFYASLNRQMLESVIGRRLRDVAVLPVETLKAAERDLVYCRGRNIDVVTFWDSAYPAALREIFDPPFLLFVRGTLPRGDVPWIAVVGTREPTAAAVVATERLAADLATAGCPVVSGLARGIDAAAHRGALARRVAGGSGGVASDVPTGAVLGCGIDRIYPASNRSLAAHILDDGGFIVSEYSPGVGAAKYHFPARNRIISGLARGVVVVQAPVKSGALITADYALDQGRDLFVHAEGLSGATGAGTRELAEDGAAIVRDARDILNEWGLSCDVADVVRDAGVSQSAGGPEAGAQLADAIRNVLVLERGDE